MMETTCWLSPTLWQRHALLVARIRFRRLRHVAMRYSTPSVVMFVTPARSPLRLLERSSMAEHSRCRQLSATRSSTRSAILRYTTSARVMALFRTQDRARQISFGLHHSGVFAHVTG